MYTYEDGSVAISKEEYQSLSRLVGQCHDRISGLVDESGFLGRDHYHALQMWDEKLKRQGNLRGLKLTDFIDDGRRRKRMTIDTWLIAYGQSNQGSEEDDEE